MIVDNLIERALEQAGTVVAVVVHPERGSGATISYVNQAFCSLVRRTRGALLGVSISEILGLVSDAELATELLLALVAGRSAQLDLPLLVDREQKLLGLRLTFPESSDTDVRHGMITGRDITEIRRVAKQEEGLRRLLASIFIRINAPVAIVSASGHITMANPAFHHLHGYSPEELKSLVVDDLTPPEYADAARDARAKQLRDGERYEMKFETLIKGGARKLVWLTSVLLRDDDQSMRVVTLTPDPFPVVSPGLEQRRATGELRAVSLEAFRMVFGADWPRIASRAMLRADQVIRRRLGREDTISRIDDHRFVIWFESGDRDRNETILAAIVRDVRLRFLTEFGEEIASQVTATLVPDAPASSPLGSSQGQPAKKILSAFNFYEPTATPGRRER